MWFSKNCQRVPHPRQDVTHFRAPAQIHLGRIAAVHVSRRSSRSKASSSDNLLRIDSSMLMRSMASVYSPSRSSGMTTSSLILNALVCLAMAAVRARSNQNLRRASALTAMKPSPVRALAMRTTSEVAAATALSSSPTMSPNSTIFGSTPRLDLAL